MPSRFTVVRALVLLTFSAWLQPGAAAAQSLTARIETGAYPHAITVDSAANRVYVANYYAGTVSIIDALTNHVTTTIPISAAWDVGLSSAGNRIYVSRDFVEGYEVHNAENGNFLAFVSAPQHAREITVNSQTDRVYVSNPYNNQIRVFDGTTHQALALIRVSHWLYDLAVDLEKNLVYGANYGVGALTVIDGATNTVADEVTPGSSGNSWAVAVNPLTNKIYLTKLNTVGGGEVVVLDRTSLATIKTLTLDGAAGVAVNEKTNRVYVTLYGQGGLAVLDGVTDTVVSVVPVGGQWPERVQVHRDLGRVYVTDGFTTSTISVFQDAVPNTAPTADAGGDVTTAADSVCRTSVTLNGGGSDPDGDELAFEWRDESGVVLGRESTITLSALPLGTHRFTLTVDDGAGGTASDDVLVSVVDTTPPVLALSGSNPLNHEAGTSFADPGATAVDNCAGDLSAAITAVSNVDPGAIGTYIVAYTVSDPSGNAAQAVRDVHVVDTRPPMISAVTASRDVLWPPNGRMIPVVVSVNVADAVDPAPRCTVVDITSNEPVGASADWGITGPLSLELRAQRLGGSSQGRVYAIHVRCSDASGNGTEASVTVRVPHDQRPAR